MAGQEVNLAIKFSANVELLATTAVGAFDGKTARMDFTDAEEMFWEQLGGVYAKEITEARGEQTYDQLSHFRRKVYGNRYEVQLEIDKATNCSLLLTSVAPMLVGLLMLTKNAMTLKPSRRLLMLRILERTVRLLRHSTGLIRLSALALVRRLVMTQLDSPKRS